MYYKNKTFSFSQKLLNPIVKYKQTKKGAVDAFVTKTGLQTNQKIYAGRAKSGLLAYLKKEGNNFKSRKKLGEEVKHLIISPISPELYNKLNNEEKEKLKNLIVKQIFKDLGKFGFFGAIENKKRGDLDHFHIHLAINKNYDINPKNVDYLKRSITRTILQDEQLKTKLGLKTTTELKKETFTNKYKNVYKRRINAYNEIKIYFYELKNINKDINILKRLNFYNFEDIKDLNKERKNELYYIDREKDFLINDIKDSKEVLKYKYEKFKDLNKEFSDTYEFFSKRKDEASRTLYNELYSLQNELQNDIFYFKDFLNIEHLIYVQFLKRQLKNKEIDLPTFLYLVASNKSYKKQRILWKKEEIKQRIKQKQEEIKNKLKDIERVMKNSLLNIQNKKYFLHLEVEYDKKKIAKLYEKLKSLNTTKKNTFETYKQRIDIILSYIKKRNEIIEKKIREQQQKQAQIRAKKIESAVSKVYNKSNNEINEIIEIALKNGLLPEEIQMQIEKFKKDKKQHPDINFKNYIMAYIKQKEFMRRYRSRETIIEQDTILNL